MKEIEKLRRDFEKIRMRLVKLEGREIEKVFENNNYIIRVEDYSLQVTFKKQENRTFWFNKGNSFPLLVEAVDEAKKRFEQ